MLLFVFIFSISARTVCNLEIQAHILPMTSSTQKSSDRRTSSSQENVTLPPPSLVFDPTRIYVSPAFTETNNTGSGFPSESKTVQGSRDIPATDEGRRIRLHVCTNLTGYGFSAIDPITRDTVVTSCEISKHWSRKQRRDESRGEAKQPSKPGFDYNASCFLDLMKLSMKVPESKVTMLEYPELFKVDFKNHAFRTVADCELEDHTTRAKEMKMKEVEKPKPASTVASTGRESCAVVDPEIPEGVYNTQRELQSRRIAEGFK
jgi:hypothetical protein